MPLIIHTPTERQWLDQLAGELYDRARELLLETTEAAVVVALGVYGDVLHPGAPEAWYSLAEDVQELLTDVTRSDLVVLLDGLQNRYDNGGH